MSFPDAAFSPHFDIAPHPDHPGWQSWRLLDDTLYNAFLGELIVQRRSERSAAMRMFPERRHANLAGAVHGGTMMGFIDVSLFSAAHLLTDMNSGFSVTLELQTHFVGAAKGDEMIESQVEIVRETGRFLFQRGLVVQGADEAPMASFTAIIKKSMR